MNYGRCYRVPGCWSVRPNHDGVWRVQMGERDIQPAPVTTNADVSDALDAMDLYANRPAPTPGSH